MPFTCEVCKDSGHVCENHPDRPWGELVDGGCDCGGAGMPCPECCSPVPQDGTHSIVEAFTPDHLRDETTDDEEIEEDAEPRILIIVPTLARPHRVEPMLDALDELADPRVDVLYVATEGDEDELAELERLEVDYVTLPAELESWARKINLGFRERVLPGGYEWALLGADDVLPRAGWYDAVLAKHAETDCCVIGTNDLHNRLVLAGRHSTHPAVNRDYWACGTIDQTDLVCHEGYRHWYVDTELVETARARGTYAHAHDAIVEHFHPIWKGAPMDATYEIGQSFVTQDRRLFVSRRNLWTRLARR